MSKFHHEFNEETMCEFYDCHMVPSFDVEVEIVIGTHNVGKTNALYKFHELRMRELELKERTKRE